MTGSRTDNKRRMRLDNTLVVRGLAPSRARARDAILRGHVIVDGTVAAKPAQSVPTGAEVAIDDPAGGYVSRSALKLAAAIDHFEFATEGVTALDIGASTGGFTEVLLERGARRVYCVDVGHDQLHQRIADDARIVNLEGVNARDLGAETIEEPISAIVADVSFISLKLALPPSLGLAGNGGWGIFLVKPQFEVGRDNIGKGGIVRDKTIARRAVDDMAGWLEADMGLTVDGIIDSPIAGGDGNQEYLVGARRG